MRNQSDGRKKIVYAAAAAVVSTGLFTPSSAGVPPSPSAHANACSKPTCDLDGSKNIHETLWGGPDVWQEETHSSSTLKIPRGGTDEFPPSPSSKNKKDSSSAKKGKKEDSAPNPIVKEILKHDNYYDILGLSKGESNASKIKKAYRRRALQTHPDKTGGDRRAFDKVSEAYDVLTDDQKRAIYDRYGKAGLDPTRGMAGGGPTAAGGRAPSAEDLFRSFFGQAPPQRGPVNPTVQYQLQVSLEDLYQGITKKVIVEAPRGSDFYSQFQPQQSKKKQVEVVIPRGARPGQSVVLSGAMDFDSDDGPPGDLIFQLQPKPHKSFTRKGHDLAKEESITFREAIFGFTRRFQHLDGRFMTVESAKHKIAPATLGASERPKTEESEDDAEESMLAAAMPSVYIQTGDVQVLKGKGMPKNPQGTEFGDMYLQFTVKLPRAATEENLTPSERLELVRLLEKLEGKSHTAASSSKKESPSKGKQAALQLQKAKLSDFGRASGSFPEMEEDHHTRADEDSQQGFPFPGMGHRQFFYSATGQSPFFGQQTNFEADENVQCRNM